MLIQNMKKKCFFASHAHNDNANCKGTSLVLIIELRLETPRKDLTKSQTDNKIKSTLTDGHLKYFKQFGTDEDLKHS